MLDSWIIATSPLSLNLVRTSDALLSIIQSQKHDVIGNSTTTGDRISGTGQFLTILVTSVSRKVAPFTIRLRSTEFQDFKSRVTCPVLNLKNIQVEASLSEQFTQVFKDEISKNPSTQVTRSSLEHCIGCMQTTADVKIQRTCLTLPQENLEPRRRCVECSCRPMWCSGCLAKWFASRQDQSNTASWLSSRAPCPTCRSLFCILDVLPIAD